MRTSTMLLNGAATLLGSGLNHRNLDKDQLAELAASVVSGERQFIPSKEQMCVICRIPRYLLTKHLKARRKNGSNGNGNGADMDFLDRVAALQADVEDELGTSPTELTKAFTEIATRLGVARALDALAMIERANSET